MISSSKSKIPPDFTNFLANNENKNNTIFKIFEVYKDDRAKTLNVLKTNELILSGDEKCFELLYQVFMQWMSYQVLRKKQIERLHDMHTVF